MLDDCLECGRNTWTVLITATTNLVLEDDEVTDRTIEEGVESVTCDACGNTLLPGEGLPFEACDGLLDA